MRRLAIAARASTLWRSFSDLKRRRGWILENGSPRQFANLMLAGIEFGLKRDIMRAWPAVIKVDISLLSDPRSPSFVQASSSHDVADPLYRRQSQRDRKMLLDQYRALIDEVRGRTLAVSLSDLGDPLMHPDLPEICAITHEAGINARVHTGFSFRLSDARVDELVRSGLSHLTVRIDVFRPDTYESTSSEGRTAIVLDNLERLLARRQELGRRYPKVEVEYAGSLHEADRIAETAEWCHGRGVDQFTHISGDLHNDTNLDPEQLRIFGVRDPGLLPRCFWPHFALQVTYDGNVIPCCTYRTGEQYEGSADNRAIGNVFEAGLWSVWNSEEYRRLRRFVADPTEIHSDPSLETSFCHGCPRLFRTNTNDKILVSNHVEWEDTFPHDEYEHVVSRSALETRRIDTSPIRTDAG